MLTWTDYGPRVDRIAGGLSTLGVGAGDTVPIMLRNHPQALLADVAALHLGRLLDEDRAVQTIPFRLRGYRMFSAHQMGSCRMGSDPHTSVAGPFGELHDTRGVWNDDGSAFPTPSGVSPMLSIMALAHRTAAPIATAAGKPTTAATA